MPTIPDASAGSFAGPFKGPWTWLRGDLHTHCEDAAQIGDYVDRIDPRLDFVALTNHGQKPVFFQQHHMVADLRQRWSGGLVLSGVEWNAPGGGHACVVFPPHPDEAERAYALARGFDRHIDTAEPDIAGGLHLLRQAPAGERPVLCFNHPSPGQWSDQTIATYLLHDPGGSADRVPDHIVIGIEGVHGHQGYEAGNRWDLAEYPGCMTGGLVDTVFNTGRCFAMLAHSDFHIHKQDRLFDYGPGIFNHTLVGVAPGQTSAGAIFAGLRAGRTCAAQGHWLQLADFVVTGLVSGSESDDGQPCARIGDRWHGDGGLATVTFEASEPLTRVDWLGSIDGGACKILQSSGPLPVGQHQLQFDAPPGARGYLRLRILSASNQRPAPAPAAPKGFFTSPIFLD